MIIHALVLACCFINTHPLGWGAVNLALATADYETAHAFQHAPNTTGHWCVESNPLFGRGEVPRRATFYTRGLPLDFAIESLGWYINRKVPKKLWVHKVWRFPFAAVSYSHISGIVSNVSCP